MEKIYRALRYTDARKVSFGEFQLEGPAKEWWRVIEEKWELEGRPKLWSAFLDEFRKKFIPKVVRERKEEEFIGLRQRLLTVAQYEVQFTKLSKYAPDMVNTEEKRKRRFLQGLNLGIQRSLVSARMDTYADMVEFAQKAEDCESKWKDFQGAKKAGPRTWVRGSSSQGQARPVQKGTGGFPQKRKDESRAFTPAKREALPVKCFFCGVSGHRESECWRKAGKCLLCGSTEHIIKDCPRNRREVTQPVISTPAQRGRPAIAAKPKVAARVYAIDRAEVESEANVVEGTLSVSGKLAKVLIDPGSTHSFVRPKFIKTLGLKSEMLPYLVEVSTPTGGRTLESDKMCKDCEVMVCNKVFPVNLISLPINGYDVILGMDWLAQYYVQINCRTKDVSFCLPGEPVLNLNFRKTPKTISLITGTKAGKLLNKGATGYLAYLVNQPADRSQLDQVLVVKEFSDVFPEKLDSTPPGREVEFGIELLPGVAPISKTPYRMAPAELQELKIQLQDLLKQ